VGECSGRTGNGDEEKRGRSMERNLKAIRINTSLAWMSRGDESLGRWQAAEWLVRQMGAWRSSSGYL
jgi:hypothetical protein